MPSTPFIVPPRTVGRVAAVVLAAAGVAACGAPSSPVGEGANVVAAADRDAMIGFTAVDVSITKGEHLDWGVLGLAYLDNRVGVVSSFRMRREDERARVVARLRLDIPARDELDWVVILEGGS